MSKGLVNMPRACIALRGVLDWRTRKTAQALIAGGFDVTIVQFADPSIICDCRGLNVINVAPPFMGGSKVKWRPLRVALNLGPLRLAAALSQKKQGLFFNEIIYKSIINERPDIIHGINVDVLEACTMAAKKLGAYLIYEAYEYWPDHLTEEALYYSQEQRNHAARIEEICIGSVDRVITVSPVLAKAYQEHYKLTSCPEIVYNAPLTISQSAAQPSTPLRLLFLGNLQRERNVMTVLKAALRVPGVALTFQGSGDMKAELLSVIESNDAADRVFIREPVPLDEVTRSAQEHDVGIVAHQAYNVQMEGALPNKFFEYLSGGLAVIVPSTETFREFPGIDTFGLLVEEPDEIRLSETFEVLKDKKDEIFEMKTSALKAASKYTGTSQLEKIQRIYRDLLRSIPKAS